MVAANDVQNFFFTEIRLKRIIAMFVVCLQEAVPTKWHQPGGRTQNVRRSRAHQSATITLINGANILDGKNFVLSGVICF